MIDTHAHAGPGLGPWLQKPAARAAKLVDRLLPRLESVTSLRNSAGRSTRRVLDFVASVALVPQVAASGTLAELDASMERAGVTRTLVIASPPAAANDWLLEAVKAHPRVVPVAHLPAQPTEEAFEALVDRGARGFKIHPNMDPASPGSPAYQAMFEVASRRGLFVILHTGTFDAFVYRSHAHADPAAFVPLFQRYPDVRVCLAHMGRDRPDDVWRQMRRFEQLYTDTSWQPAEVVKRALSAVSKERILLGSDWPLLHADLQRDAVEILRRAAGDEDVERIGHANALTFLGEA